MQSQPFPHARALGRPVLENCGEDCKRDCKGAQGKHTAAARMSPPKSHPTAYNIVHMCNIPCCSAVMCYGAYCSTAAGGYRPLGAVLDGVTPENVRFVVFGPTFEGGRRACAIFPMPWDRLPIRLTGVKRARRTAAVGVTVRFLVPWRWWCGSWRGRRTYSWRNVSTSIPTPHPTPWSRSAALSIRLYLVIACGRGLSSLPVRRASCLALFAQADWPIRHGVTVPPRPTHSLRPCPY